MSSLTQASHGGTCPYTANHNGQPPPTACPASNCTQEFTSSTPAYHVQVILRIKPDRRDDFLACILTNQQQTLSTEPLALSYVFGEDETTPNTFHFSEAYKSKQGFEDHCATPHFAAWEKFVQTDPFTQPPEVYKFVDHTGVVAPGPADARDKAVHALLGGRDPTNLGFDTILTRIRDPVRGTVVEIFVEECYATWTSQYSVVNGAAEFIEGSRSGDDGSKKWPEGWETGGDTISGWKRWAETVSGTSGEETCLYAARHKGQAPPAECPASKCPQKH